MHGMSYVDLWRPRGESDGSPPNPPTKFKFLDILSYKKREKEREIRHIEREGQEG